MISDVEDRSPDSPALGKASPASDAWQVLHGCPDGCFSSRGEATGRFAERARGFEIRTWVAQTYWQPFFGGGCPAKPKEGFFYVYAKQAVASNLRLTTQLANKADKNYQHAQHCTTFPQR